MAPSYSLKPTQNEFHKSRIYRSNELFHNEDVSEEFEEIETSLIFETPNYKVRVGNFKNIIDASKNLESIKRKFRSAFILKNDEL